ncbi:uncharacterized protein LOC121410087 [Lytechinus variegatus]|uniref:uncharacterized protein LOC121410087 n=1 Tax=Lytechinus variegatus TaxID=7654 RepID=UPI001BB2A47D|nr:uncharacterized protein LOC121410087 [Lytechinus variegatus]
MLVSGEEELIRVKRLHHGEEPAFSNKAIIQPSSTGNNQLEQEKPHHDSYPYAKTSLETEDGSTTAQNHLSPSSMNTAGVGRKKRRMAEDTSFRGIHGRDDDMVIDEERLKREKRQMMNGGRMRGDWR